MSEPRKGTCSVCGASVTYYGETTQYCISDYAKLEAELKEWKDFAALHDKTGRQYKEQCEKLANALDSLKAKIEQLDDDRRYYKNEFENAIERIEYRKEEILDLKQEVAILRKDNDNHVKRYKEMSKI